MCPTGVQADTVVEVVVRVAGDLHDVAYVRDGTYPAGVCDVDIADARRDLAERSSVVIERGLVTITLRLVEPSRTPVPLARLERRPLIYGASSLALHLGLWFAAIQLGGDLALPSVSAESKGRRARISSTFASAAQTVKQADKPEPAEVPVTTDTTPAPVPAAEEEQAVGAEDHIGMLPEPGEGDLVVDPPSTQGGDSRRFDPDVSAEFDTVKVGAYSTVSTGKLSGEHYGTEGKRNGLIVVSCDAASCIVLGGENAAPIRKAVEENLAEITACYANQVGTAGRKIEIDFGMGADGKVDGLKVGGVGDVGDCVAQIIKRTSFGA